MNNYIGEVQHWSAFRRHFAMKTAPVLEVERGIRSACGPPARRLPHAGGSATCNVSNLSARGEQEAIRVGQALRTMKMSIGKVLSSDVCRVRDSARLLDIGNFDIDEDLSNVPKRSGHDVHAARMRLLATPPPAGTNILLVSHMHAGNRNEQPIYPDFGEIIVYRPDRKGGSDAVARIRMHDWRGLASTGNTVPLPGAR